MALLIAAPSAKPLVGFGPAGWVAAAIFVVLAALVLAGFDMQGALLTAIYNAFGGDAPNWYVVHIQAGHWISLRAPTYGLISLLYFLPALAIAPFRIPWWKYALVVIWALVHPLLLWYRLVLSPLATLLPNDPGALILAQCVHELSTVFLLWLITRSRRVFLLSLAATIAVNSISYGLTVAPGLLATTPWVNLTDSILGPAWHLAIAATLLGWAISARLSANPPQCPQCGYHLRFIASPRCPECGQTLRAT